MTTPSPPPVVRVTTRAELSQEQLERTGQRIVAGTWGCAAITMAASAANAALTYGALGDNRALGLATGVAVDIGLCVALIGDRRLYAHGLSSSWGRVLRVTTALMSLVLNVGISLRDGHYFAALLHSFLPVLLIVLCEYGQDVLLQFTALRRQRETEQAPTSTAPGAVNLPAPTYQRVVPSSSWVAPRPPASASQPMAVPEPQPVVAPVPERVAASKPEPLVEVPAVTPVPVEQPAPDPVTDVDRHGGEQVKADKPTVNPAPEPEPAEAPPSGPRVSGHELDALIADILTVPGNAEIGRRRITELLPDPKPTDHAVKTALARVRAARQPMLNGAGVPAGSGSTGGSDDG